MIKFLMIFNSFFAPSLFMKNIFFLIALYLLIYNQNKFKPHLTRDLNKIELKILIILFVLMLIKIISYDLRENCEICAIFLIFSTKILLFIIAIKKFIYYQLLINFGKKFPKSLKCNNIYFNIF